MYTKYFGLTEKPFTLTSNPRYYYLSKSHKEAFAHLLHGINKHYGLIELIGEVGTGKTTLLRNLLVQLQEKNFRTALIFKPYLSSVELLRCINKEYGIDASGASFSELLPELNRFLVDENANGRTVVLVIDEAQKLAPELLELIRLISNLETKGDKLAQIILAGQPELESLLAKPEHCHINQRIAMRYRLKPIAMEETLDYITHRMKIAGEMGSISFTSNAIKIIYAFSQGVPSLINILCDRALLVAYGNKCHTISTEVIRQACHETKNIEQRGFVLRKIKFGLVLIASIAVFVYLSFRLLPFVLPQKSQMTIIPSSEQVTAPTDVNQLSQLENDLLTLDQNKAHLKALNELVGRWGGKPFPTFDIKLTVPGMFSKMVAKRNLRFTHFRGTLDNALRFNLPLLACTKVSGKLGAYCLAITEIKGDSLSISPALLGQRSIAKSALNSLVNGNYYLVWENADPLPTDIHEGDSSEEIENLQAALQQAGYFNGDITGLYGPLTSTAVRKFQQSQGITLNKTVGELTVAALISSTADNNFPLLKKIGE